MNVEKKRKNETRKKNKTKREIKFHYWQLHWNRQCFFFLFSFIDTNDDRLEWKFVRCVLFYRRTLAGFPPLTDLNPRVGERRYNITHGNASGSPHSGTRGNNASELLASSLITECPSSFFYFYLSEIMLLQPFSYCALLRLNKNLIHRRDCNDFSTVNNAREVLP